MTLLVLDHYRLAGQLLGLVTQAIGFGNLELVVNAEDPCPTIRIRWIVKVKGSWFACDEIVTHKTLELCRDLETFADLLARKFKHALQNQLASEAQT